MHNIHDKYIKERLQVRQNAIDFLKVAISDHSLYKINMDTLGLLGVIQGIDYQYNMLVFVDFDAQEFAQYS